MNEKNVIYEAIMQDCAEPDEELINETLKAMTRRRTAKEQKTAARNKVFKKLVATAAIIAVAVGFTPLGGYVAHAAEDVYSWVKIVFHVGMKQSVDDIEFEVVESSIANNTLYFTLDTRANYYMAHNGYEGSFYTDRSLLLDISGEIADNKGNRLTFTDENIALNTDHNSEQVTEDNMEQRQILGWVNEYAVYLPDLEKLINSDKKNYTCTLHIKPHVYDNDGKEDKTDSAVISFPIKNVDAVVTSEEYDISYSYTLENIRFDFVKLHIGKTQSDILVKLTPKGDMKEVFSQYESLDKKILNASCYNDKFYHGDYFYVEAYVSLPNSETPVYGSWYEAGLSWERGNGYAEFTTASHLFRRDNDYYILLNTLDSQNYRYDIISQLKGNMTFRVDGFRYYHEASVKGENENDTVIQVKENESVFLLTDSFQPENCVYEYVEITGQNTKAIQPTTDIYKDEENDYFSFYTDDDNDTTLHFGNGKWAFDVTYVSNYYVTINNIHHNGKWVEDNFYVKDGRFSAKKKGKTIRIYTNAYSGIDSTYDIPSQAILAKKQTPDALEFEYLILRFDKIDENYNCIGYSQYFLTNPNYKTAEQWKAEDAAERERLQKRHDTFEANCTFTITR